jgi:hypothetical protein
MKRWIGWIVLGLILLMLPTVSSANGLQYERVIIGFQDDIDESLLAEIPHEIHHRFEELSAISVSIPEEEREVVRKNPKVKWMEKDHPVRVDGQVVDWGQEKVGVSQEINREFTGKGVKVAVIDTGISSTHPDLHVAEGVSFVEEEFSFSDKNGHGTHVAGVIAASNNTIGVVGVAPDVSLYAIKALDAEGLGNQADVIAGIEWAITHQVDIINLSLTTPYDSITLRKALEKAYEHGIIVTAASGNDELGLGQEVGSDIMYPARFPTVIAVGSVNKSLKRSTFSYFGNALEFSAPGEKIYSTYVSDGGKTNEYAFMSGTSMAVPYVTGVIALYEQAFPEMSTEEIRKRMQQNVIDLGVAGKDEQYGYGLIQAPWEENTTGFKDVSDTSWYTASIQYLVDNDYIGGYPDKTFRPQSSITREEAVTMIGRILNLNGSQRETAFKDVTARSFGSGYIASATNQNIINGYPDGTFRPDQSITRGDVAVLFQQAFDYTAYNIGSFPDVSKEKYYFKAINALKEAQITAGYPDGTFRPKKQITRAEFSVFLTRAIAPEVE